MLYRPGTRREGISLLEVLTAIFIMGIGMLALLTLFPLGALSMARAVRDDRAAHIAANAAAVAAALDLRNDENIVAAIESAELEKFRVINTSHPSNPVFVDPAYVRLNAQPLGKYPATGATTEPGTKVAGILRAAPMWLYRKNDGTYREPPSPRGSGILKPALIAYWFTFQDEIEFDTFGGAKGWKTSPPGNGNVNRPGTYSHAYMVRRPRQSTRELLDLTVVVYASRNTDNVEGEDVIHHDTSASPPTKVQSVSDNTKNPIAGDTSIKVDYGNLQKPDFRKGTWILDVSSTFDRSDPDPKKHKETTNGHFYRIENTSESGTTFTLELDRPLKATMTSLVVMKNVIAVVERGTAWRP